MPKLAKISLSTGLLGQQVRRSKTYFLKLAYKSDLFMDFEVLIDQKTWNRATCASWR